MDFDVVELGDADHVDEGDEAPDFERPLVNDEYWADASLADLTDDGPVLLVFHPMAGSFPALYVWKELTSRAWDDDYDVRPVGVSISDPYGSKRLVEDRGMDYELFSDPQNGVAAAYGVVNDLDGMAGVSEPRPAVFLVDEDRVVQYAWVAEEWPDFPDYDAVEAAVADHC
jgi:peroxiredoxin